MTKFVIQTPLSVKPDLVDPAIFGHHKSYVVSSNESNRVRQWEFDSESGVRKFERAVKRGAFTKRVPPNARRV